MHNMALALHHKGFEVTGSDDVIFEPSKSRLEKQKLLPKRMGWFPNKITTDLDAIILGMHAREDNSEMLKAKDLNIPILALSQLSRAVENRTDHRPIMSDLRESGAIEQDADLVLLLLREEYYNPTDENRGIAEVIIAKQRNGPVGSIKLAFIAEYAKFENLSYREGE